MKKIFLTVLLITQIINVKAFVADDSREDSIQSLISKMTLKEKTSLLHGNSKFYVEAIPRLGIPELALSDGPHGVRAEINRHDWGYAGRDDDFATCFPPATSLAATWNKDLAALRGAILGKEARFRKKDILLGPGVNIIRSPLCGRNFEYLSEDPVLSSVMAVSYIKSLQEQDVAGSVKHWLANNQETERGVVNVEMSERALREIYLPAFKASIVDAGVHTVMAAYNKFRGDWCSENDYLNNKILRGEFGFDGLLMTDWDAAHSTVKAAKNSLDLEMGTHKEDYNQWYFADPLIEAVRKGEVSESEVDKKVANILRTMFRVKIFDPANREKGEMNTKKHQEAAYLSAVESIVLLKNQKILPLNDSKIKSVAVIGDNATRKHCNGGLSSEIKALYEV
ncbi:MAG: glycoside hydrolase family 3 protein, partial [Bacteroidales bacterium]